MGVFGRRGRQNTDGRSGEIKNAYLFYIQTTENK